MNVEIRDVNAVRAIRPVEAMLYLRAQGWKESKVITGRASVWVREEKGDEYEILLPMEQETRDYSLRMGDLLRVLAVVESRSQSEIYNDVLTITADVIRIRIADPDLADGSMPIEQYAQVAQGARDLILAAACAATEHRPVWHTRKPMQAVETTRKARVGQTERGSYVTTIICRVPPLLHGQAQGQLFGETPFERVVTQTLANSLHELNAAAEQAALTQKLEAFEAAVSKGVNANLCDAVVGIWGSEESQRTTEFSFTWSPTRPPESGIPRRVAISADRIPLIREASRMMRARSPVPDFELQGAVIKLERAEGAPTGKITVVGLLDDRQVRVTVELGDAPYHLAVQAHDEGKTLRAFGTLKKEGRSLVLQDPREVEIQEE